MEKFIAMPKNCFFAMHYARARTFQAFRQNIHELALHHQRAAVEILDSGVLAVAAFRSMLQEIRECALFHFWSSFCSKRYC